MYAKLFVMEPLLPPAKSVRTSPPSRTSTFADSPTVDELRYQKVAEEILRFLRGDKSQREFSEDLGFSFNQLGKWESGATKIKWDNFLELAEVLNLPVEKTFRQANWNFEESFTATSAISALLERRKNFKLPWPELKLRRWQRGESVPDFSEVLQLYSMVPAEFFSWMSGFIDCSKIESLQIEHALVTKRIEMASTDPVCVYINAALSLKDYIDAPFHNEELLAQHATCSISHLRNALALLLEAGIISFDGTKYHPCPFDFSTGGARMAGMRNLTKYTTDLAARIYPVVPLLPNSPRPVNQCHGSVRVTAMSEAASKQLGNLVSKFHADVGELVAADSAPKDGVQVVILHSFASNFNSTEQPPL